MDSLYKPKQKRDDYEIDSQSSPKTRQSIEKIMKGAETQKREANKEILQNMMFRKIKEKNDKLLSGENAEGLTNEIKTFLHQTMHNFHALKGITSVNDNVSLGNMVNGLLKRKNDYEKLTIFERDTTKNGGHEKERKKPLMDYKLAETALLKRFNECIGEIQKIRDKIIEINHDSYILRVEIKQLTAEVILFFIFEITEFYNFISIERRSPQKIRLPGG